MCFCIFRYVELYLIIIGFIYFKLGVNFIVEENKNKRGNKKVIDFLLCVDVFYDFQEIFFYFLELGLSKFWVVFNQVEDLIVFNYMFIVCLYIVYIVLYYQGVLCGLYFCLCIL